MTKHTNLPIQDAGLLFTGTDLHRRDAIEATGFVTAGALLGLGATSTLLAADSNGDPAMAQALSPPEYNPSSEYVFSITATIAGAMTVGETVTGQVRAIPITGGVVEGDNIKGVVIPGGADWQRTRNDGVTEIEATYAIELGGNTLVKVVNRGIIARAGQASEAPYFRTRIMFTAPQGEYDWLNKSIFLCHAGLHPTVASAVLVEVFRLV